MSNKAITQANATQIEDFFYTYEEQTKPIMQAFLFDMMGMFAASQEDLGHQYRADCVLHFKMLNDLVNGLQVPNSK